MVLAEVVQRGVVAMRSLGFTWPAQNSRANSSGRWLCACLHYLLIVQHEQKKERRKELLSLLRFFVFIIFCFHFLFFQPLIIRRQRAHEVCCVELWNLWRCLSGQGSQQISLLFRVNCWGNIQVFPGREFTFQRSRQGDMFAK